MAANQGMVERRKHKRYQAQDGAIAAFRNHAIKVGQIMDISLGGLSFQYIDEGEQPKKSFDLDIFLTENVFRIESVPAQTISDFEIVSEVPYSSVKIRRHGAEFGELTQKQVSQLHYFFQNHTTGEA